MITTGTYVLDLTSTIQMAVLGPAMLPIYNEVTDTLIYMDESEFSDEIEIISPDTLKKELETDLESVDN